MRRVTDVAGVHLVKGTIFVAAMTDGDEPAPTDALDKLLDTLR